MNYLRFISTLILSCLSGLLISQIVHQDTLREFTFVHTNDKVSEVFRSDSIPEAILVSSIDLVESLRKSSAMFIKDYGPGNIASIGVRGGSAQQVEVYWNGMSINTPSLGSTDISLLPNTFFDQVELNIGSSALRRGTGALAGALQLQSYLPLPGKKVILKSRLTPHTGESVQQMTVSGSSSKFSWRSSLHRRLADNRFLYQESASGIVTERQRENAGLRSFGLSQDFTWKLGEQWSLGFSMHGYDSDRDIASPIGIPSADQRQVDQVFRGLVKAVHTKGKVVEEFPLAGVSEYLRYIAVQAEIDSEINNSKYHIRYQQLRELGGDGLLRVRIDNDNSQVVLNDDQRPSINEFGVYLGAEKQFGRAKITTGIRQEWLNDRINPLTGALGLNYKIGEQGFALSASASSSYRNPTVNDLYWPDLGNEDLRAERGISSDLGILFNSEYLTASVSSFTTQVDNMILWIPGFDGRFRPLNVSRSKAHGLEVGCNVRANRFELFSIRYSLTESEIRNSEGTWRKGLYQPRHQLNAHAQEQWMQLSLGVNYNFYSSVIADHTGSPNSQLDPIHLLDTRLSWVPDYKQNVTLSFGVNNLFDKNYQYVKDRPIPSRHVQIQLIIRLYENP